MIATGIVRRIDDLGRVVIPKEIRRTMRIREGNPLITHCHHSTSFVLRYIVWWRDIRKRGCKKTVKKFRGSLLNVSLGCFFT